MNKRSPSKQKITVLEEKIGNICHLKNDCLFWKQGP